MQREDEGGGGGRSKPKPPIYGVWQPPVQKTWTWPRIPVPSNWLWPNGRFNAVAYTRFEISKTIASAKATEIRSLNHKANATSHALAGAARKTLANAEWGLMVAPNRPWDHKPKITAITKSLEPVNKTGGWQQVGGEEYRFDTWSNVHYGYVGRSVGFSAEWLQTAASLAQFGDDLRHRKPSQYNPENGGFLNRFDDDSRSSGNCSRSQALGGLWNQWSRPDPRTVYPGAAGGPRHGTSP